MKAILAEPGHTPSSPSCQLSKKSKIPSSLPICTEAAEKIYPASFAIPFVISTFLRLYEPSINCEKRRNSTQWTATSARPHYIFPGSTYTTASDLMAMLNESTTQSGW
ncbi:unnamed protein product, partial [Sphacelaria rigidula]